MTNGEIIQKVFTCEVCEAIIEDDIIHVIFADKKDSAIGFDWSWWNAEYKEPTTKNNIGVDCISRVDARKTIIDHQYSDSFCEEHNIDHSINTGMALIALSDLPSATPQLSSGLDKNSKKLEKDFGELDCISRADARSLICKIDIKHRMFGMSRKAFKDLYNGMDELPSVTPQEPKTGHWILTDVEGYRVWHCNCSECGKDPQDYIGGSENWWLIKSNLPKFCPNCGSRNEVEE